MTIVSTKKEKEKKKKKIGERDSRCTGAKANYTSL